MTTKDASLFKEEPDVTEEDKDTKTEDAAEADEGTNVESPFLVGEDFDPAKVPEQFLKEGKVDIQALIAGATPAEPPEKYELEYPEIEGLTSDELKELVPEDDPVVQGFNEFAKSQKFSQGQYAEAVKWFLGTQIELDRQVLGETRAELEKMDKDIIDRNEKFFKANLSPEAYGAMRGMMVSVSNVKLADELRKLVKGGSKLPGGGGDNVSSKLTRAELKAIMATDAYTDPKHPEYAVSRQKVADGYKALGEGK